MGFSVEQAAKLYGIPLLDFGRGRGVLISSGCGIMVGVMDQVAFRWCIDADQLTRGQQARLGSFAEMAGAQGPVAVCGWFSLSDPTPLVAALQSAPPPVLAYAGGKRFGVDGEASNLDEFIEKCRRTIGQPLDRAKEPKNP